MINIKELFCLEESRSVIGVICRKMYYIIQSVIWPLVRLFLHIETKDKKYNVSICAIFKDEGCYLKEWIEFHLVVGVEHFYLYNNNSTDNYMVVLEPYIEKEIVTLIEYPGERMQLKCYKECIQTFASETKWLGFIDIDEFVVPKKEETIYGFLKKFERNTGAVKIYWKVFGSSGRVSRDRKGLVVEDFVVCYEQMSDLGKCFYNTAFDVNLSLEKNANLYHHFYVNYKGFCMPPVNVYNKVCAGTFNRMPSNKVADVQINHYFTKSYVEYGDKRKRGDVIQEISPYDEGRFYDIEKKCMSIDYSAYKYLIKLKLQMNQVV